MNTENNFMRDYRSALDEIIAIQKIHTENGNILKTTIKKIMDLLQQKE